jgi:hypothetical protein
MYTDDKALITLTELIRSEFMEIPGLSLTRDQIQRLWSLDASVVDVVIAGLLRSGFLRLGAHDRYSRADLGRP